MSHCLLNDKINRNSNYRYYADQCSPQVTPEQRITQLEEEMQRMRVDFERKIARIEVAKDTQIAQLEQRIEHLMQENQGLKETLKKYQPASASKPRAP